jgi:hypothetical protein
MEGQAENPERKGKLPWRYDRNRSMRLSGSLRTDAVGGKLHLADALEGKKQLHQEFRRILLCLTHYLAYGVRHGGMKQDVPHLNARKVHAHGLSGLEHSFILSSSGRIFKALENPDNPLPRSESLAV